MTEKLYMVVTNDDLQLPVAVDKTKASLSRNMGKSASWADVNIASQKRGKSKRAEYLVVEVIMSEEI